MGLPFPGAPPSRRPVAAARVSPPRPSAPLPGLAPVAALRHPAKKRGILAALRRVRKALPAVEGGKIGKAYEYMLLCFSTLSAMALAAVCSRGTHWETTCRTSP